MPEGLQKKIGPLPIWAWALIMGGVIGGVILLRKGSGTAAGADVGSDTSGQIFPGATDGASSGSLTGTGGAPTTFDGVAQTAATIQALKDAGLWPDVAVAPYNDSVGYVPDAAAAVDAGPNSIAANSGTAAAPAAGKKPPALERAKAAVAKGSAGPINRKRLIKAGYTNAQIDFHIKHKTPLQQPDKVQHPKAPPKGLTPGGKPAPTHPLQHVTAAAPDHSKAPAYRPVPGKDSHGNKGVWHVYSDHKVFVRG